MRARARELRQHFGTESGMSSFWEKRPCTHCGYVRRVCVNVWRNGRTGLDEEHWNKLCTICDLLERAAIHRRAAARFEKRAVDMRMVRNAREASKRAKRSA
jgi:hypothetical protein